MGTISLQIPQSGLANSTEDPKIASDFTALQTLLNGNVDTNNISPTAAILGSQLSATAAIAPAQVTPALRRPNYVLKSISYTANAGELVEAGPGVTVTLPSPNKDDLVGIVANSTVSAASPVTISGAGIYGLGLSNVSSFTLGTPGAFAFLQYDGNGAWFIIGGRQDTGWQALTAATGYSTTQFNGGGEATGVRLVGDRVYLRGGINDNSGHGGGITGQIATVPSGLRPSGVVKSITSVDAWNAGIVSWQDRPGVLTVTSAGVMNFDTGGAAVGSNYVIGLDGINYSIS